MNIETDKVDLKVETSAASISRRRVVPAKEPIVDYSLIDTIGHITGGMPFEVSVIEPRKQTFARFGDLVRHPFVVSWSAGNSTHHIAVLRSTHDDVLEFVRADSPDGARDVALNYEWPT
jgi:hypothetical protein